MALLVHLEIFFTFFLLTSVMHVALQVVGGVFPWLDSHLRKKESPLDKYRKPMKKLVTMPLHIAPYLQMALLTIQRQ